MEAKKPSFIKTKEEKLREILYDVVGFE